MASIKREKIGLLNDKLTVTLTKEDYYPSFETSLKKHAKTANIPGFRKGMVPAGLIKKMYGQSVFSDEVLKKVEAELNHYINNEKLEIFAQPLPMDTQMLPLDVNAPSNYDFAFEVGLKPAFSLNVKGIKVKRYKVKVTDEMIQNEVERIQTRNGKMTDPEMVESDENVINITFTETDKDGTEIEGGLTKDNSLLVKYFAAKARKQFMGKKKDDTVVIQLSKAFEDKELEIIVGDLGISKTDADKYFKILITKVGLVEKAALDETLFLATYPNDAIKTEEEFRAAIKKDIEGYYEQQAKNQIHDQIYHGLIDQTKMEFHKIEVVAEDLKNFAKQQLMSYMGPQMGALGDNDKWLEDYAVRMMQDRKFVEDSYQRISTDKLFTAIESEVEAKDEAIEAEKFADMLNNHKH
ncbi:MAG: trigger factor [Sediminibacterium sp.]|nr:trigger factor [Sediminibacterium sp.]